MARQLGSIPSRSTRIPFPRRDRGVGSTTRPGGSIPLASIRHSETAMVYHTTEEANVATGLSTQVGAMWKRGQPLYKNILPSGE